jgi:hypothetical protein
MSAFLIVKTGGTSMKEKRAVTFPVVCLGAAAALFLAFAVYMFV